MPTVIVSFEPLDVLFGVYMILRQLNEGRPRLENEYIRAVHQKGNVKSQKLMHKIFEVTDGNWRGNGVIPSLPKKKFTLRKEYSEFDTYFKHGTEIKHDVDSQPSCKCHLDIVGKIRPYEMPVNH